MILLQERESIQKISFEEKSTDIIKWSFFGGIYSGLGLGGGFFLVPMFGSLGLDQIQSTATVAFCLFVVAFNNTIQAILIGAVTFQELLYFLLICGCTSFAISNILSDWMRKQNRKSFIEFTLVLLLGFALINIPYGMISKYITSGYDSKIFLGFGSLC